MAYISCQPELDGPTHYIDKKTLEIIQTCGELCDGKSCMDVCPPSQWTACQDSQKNKDVTP